MSKKPFVIFGLVLVLLAVVVPAWVFLKEGDSETGRLEVPANLKTGQSLFQGSCGNCHTLYAAGTEGDFGPNLDQRLAPAGTPTGEGSEGQIEATRTQVLNAIHNGLDDPTVPGQMPADIVVGSGAEEVAEFVAQTAGRG
ncbi:MAG: cytochrome c [Thermoleophilia bacterium]|nr:cytochrome c [Thermoleophilia bacterium]